jgi:D-3-phosphoglycerate dehydrogenase
VSRPVVLIAEELAPSVLAVLGDGFDVRHVDGADRAALLPALADADAVLIRSATQVDDEALAAAPRLKVVARAGIGLDNVDVPAATARGVMVVNAPQSNIVSAAEQAVALLLACARNLAPANAASRRGSGSAASGPASRSPTRSSASLASAGSECCSPSAWRASARR